MALLASRFSNFSWNFDIGFEDHESSSCHANSLRSIELAWLQPMLMFVHEFSLDLSSHANHMRICVTHTASTSLTMVIAIEWVQTALHLVAQRLKLDLPRHGECENDKCSPSSALLLGLHLPLASSYLRRKSFRKASNRTEVKIGSTQLSIPQFKFSRRDLQDGQGCKNTFFLRPWDLRLWQLNIGTQHWNRIVGSGSTRIKNRS